MSGLLPLPWRDRPTIMLLALQMYDKISYAQEKFWVATLQAILFVWSEFYNYAIWRDFQTVMR